MVYTWFFVYNKPHNNIEKATPDYILSSEDCYFHYKNNENSETNNYTGKVLQLTGLASSVEQSDSLTIVVFVYNNGMFGDEGIRCTMLPKYNNVVENINLKNPITIKGYCSGYNDTDVILEQCSLITN